MWLTVGLSIMLMLGLAFIWGANKALKDTPDRK